MNYENLVRDFAQRTKANLNTINRLRNSEEYEVYEVTQLINSMLGLLIFPKERYVNRIPKISLEELMHSGWPEPEIVGNHPQVRDLRELTRYIRNAIAHCNIEFTSVNELDISGICIWNLDQQNNVTWKAKLSLQDIEIITEKFIDIIVQNEA